MTYAEAVAFWYGRINYEVRAATPDDLKLERMRALLRRVGDPHLRLRVVHVAGTKGKGSTCALIDAAARDAGYKVGLFTSPHLERVEERVQVDRADITQTELAALLTELEPHVRAMDRLGPASSPTFFEIVTAAGFLHFVRRRCELVLLEVGMGGRFDSTNVCEPVATAVTSIGLDHTQQLGDTVELIAFQKAGIIKPRTPVVVGPLDAGPLGVVECVAREVGARVVHAVGRGVPAVGLPGEHQRANAAVALALVEELRAAGFHVPPASVERGFAGVAWPGRIEVVGRDPVVVIDSAHNLPSVEALIKTLPTVAQSAARPESRHLIFAVSADKPVGPMLRVLGGTFGHFHLTRYAANPRTVAPEELAAIAHHYTSGVRVTTYSTARNAWLAAWEQSGPGGLICIAGSAFLAGELRLTVLTQVSAKSE